MANVPDVTGALVAWGAFLLLFFRSLNVCTVLFVSINADVFIRASIQTHARSKRAPSTPRNRRARPDSHRRDGQAASDYRSNIPRLPNDSQPLRIQPQSPRQQSFDEDHHSIPAKQQLAISYGTIMGMFEEVIASDAETIQVQQATIQTHQEIIRSQREMIQKLQQLVEAQDAWIEEHVQEPNRTEMEGR